MSEDAADAPAPRPGPDALYGENPTPPILENGAGWTADPLLVSGCDAYVDGEYLYQDFVYDDHGADTRSFIAEPPSGAQSVGGIYQVPTGDVYYPNDPERYAYNAADLLEFRARPTEEGVAYRITLNTMLDPAAAAVAIGIDTSGTGDSNGRTDWGYGLGDLGAPADHVLVTWGEGAELDGEPVAADAVSVDVERNQIEVEVPLDPADETWRHYCVTGLWDADAHGFMQVGGDVTETTPGGSNGDDVPPVFNVGFRFDEPCEANFDRHNIHGELLGLLFAAPTNIQQLVADVPSLLGDLADPLGLFSGSGGARDLLDSIDDPFALLSAIDVPDALDDQLWRALGRGTWRDHAQALGLRDRDISSFFADIDFATLRAGTTTRNVPESGHLDLLYPSRYDFGEGLDPAHNTFEGRIQPYSVYVPESVDPDEPAPMVLLLHSLGCNHNEYEVFMPKLVEQLAAAQDAIVFTPEARGTATWFQREGELDVFEAWRDLETRFEIDRDRVSVAGYSMGGFGTLLLAEKHPDLFARGFSIVGTPAEDPLEGTTDSLFGLPKSLTGGLFGGAGGGDVLTIFTERPENALMITENLRNVELLLWNGAGDALAPLLGVGNYARRLSEQGYRHQLDVFPTTHFLPAVFDSWERGADYLAEGQADHHPKRVTYRRVPRFDYDDLGLVHDGAYWVDEIELRMGDNAFVNAISYADGYAEPDADTFQRTGASPQPYVSRGVEWTDPDPAAVRGPENALELKLRRVESVTVWVETAGLDPEADLTVEVDSDGPATVTLAGAFGDHPVNVEQGDTVTTVNLG
ncbi:alpha/beta hydrolase-fold protein [Halorarius litoreus]|uniref:alpha/beta hydrolase-fold protein n=1 Tax=Halorarius litoreus TaxID=2962676 RepID=UPI0020CBEDD0|nr:prolyl oligopeptidase family serine peptidase [Halorarius litoreus]